MPMRRYLLQLMDSKSAQPHQLIQNQIVMESKIELVLGSLLMCPLAVEIDF